MKFLHYIFDILYYYIYKIFMRLMLYFHKLSKCISREMFRICHGDFVITYSGLRWHFVDFPNNLLSVRKYLTQSILKTFVQINLEIAQPNSQFNETQVNKEVICAVASGCSWNIQNKHSRNSKKNLLGIFEFSVWILN